MKSIDEKLFALQQEIGAISKDAKNPFFKSSYFDINTLLEELKPFLGKYKLAIYQPIKNGEVHTIIKCVETKEKTEPSYLTLPVIIDPQKLGSCITYFRRYTLVSLLGLQAIDDDGNLASNRKVVAKAVNNQPEKKEDNRPWLNENQKNAVLKSTKQEAERIIRQYRIKKDFRTEINNKFKIK
jgi:hypothetical protein